MPDKTLIINDWAKGVADSPASGIALMKNVNIEAFPGAVTPNKAPVNQFFTIALSSYTTTFSNSGGKLLGDSTSGGGNISLSDFTHMAVQFSGGVLPTGIVSGTIYFLIKVSGTTFKLATTWINADAGTAINYTDSGSGTITMTIVNPATINWIVKDQRNGYYYALDSVGRVWCARGAAQTFWLLTGNTLTNANGNGLAIFANSDLSSTFLFVFRDHDIDVIPVYQDSDLNTPAWTSSWQIMNTVAGTNNDHYALVGQDNIIYFTDSRYTGSIQEKAGQVFAPGNAATYTYNNQALSLPNNEIAKCLAELGVNLLVGGLKTNKIYPWDRSAVSYNLPILVPEIGNYRMVNLGNAVYVFAGQKGNIYLTQGSYVKLFKKVPEYLTNNNQTVTASPITWGDARVRMGAILFGMSVQTTGNSGCYIIYPDGRLTIDTIPSTGSKNATAIYSETDLYFMGYNGGLDYLNSANGAYSNYDAVVQSELYRVADKTGKAKFSQLEIQTTKDFGGSSYKFRVKYRTDDKGSFADFPGATVNQTTASGTSFNWDIGLVDIENIQIQIELDGLVEILEARLFP